MRLQRSDVERLFRDRRGYDDAREAHSIGKYRLRLVAPLTVVLHVDALRDDMIFHSPTKFVSLLSNDFLSLVGARCDLATNFR